MARWRLGAALVAMTAVAAVTSACDTGFEEVRLRVAAGNSGGVYHALSAPLADACHSRLGMARPEVLETSGSPDNLKKLVSGEADIAFSAADVAAGPGSGPRTPMALARLYNDYLHLVVNRDAEIRSVADLAGKRVAIGAPQSGVAVMAERVLEVAGLSGDGTLTTTNLALGESIEAFLDGRVDAFFWSGGLPTDHIVKLAAVAPIRLLDMTDILPKLLNQYAVYNAELIPASTYQLPGAAVNTLSVPNYLLTTDAMPADLATALLETLFIAQPALIRANPAARAIDVHTAIETDPVPLHPGAVRYYRDQKL